VKTPQRTRLPRSIIDAAAWAGTGLRTQAIIASSVQQGLVTPQSLAEVLCERLNVPRHELIVETIRDVAGGSLSEYELLFLQMCRRFHLPIPTRQRRRKDAAGRWRYLDVDFDDYQLVAEVDGQQHMEALAWWEDMERNNDVVVEDGKTLLRFAGFALRRQPDRVAGVLRRFFDRHPPAGRAK
jgi:very-short-patch-repair endonuclease